MERKNMQKSNREMGSLYCEKDCASSLDIKIDIESEEGKYTEVRITFGKNDYFDTVV